MDIRFRLRHRFPPRVLEKVIDNENAGDVETAEEKTKIIIRTSQKIIGN